MPHVWTPWQGMIHSPWPDVNAGTRVPISPRNRVKCVLATRISVARNVWRVWLNAYPLRALPVMGSPMGAGRRGCTRAAPESTKPLIRRVPSYVQSLFYDRKQVAYQLNQRRTETDDEHGREDEKYKHRDHFDGRLGCLLLSPLSSFRS